MVACSIADSKMINRYAGKFFLMLYIILALVSCSSLNLLNFKEFLKRSDLKLKQRFLVFDDSSSTLRLQSFINEKKTEDTPIASFRKDDIPSGFSGLLFTGGKLESIDRKTILTDKKTTLWYRRLLMPNGDTSLVVLTQASSSAFNDEERTVFLLDLRAGKAQKIDSFSPLVNFISSKVPFATTEHTYKYYDLQCEAKWITDSTFVLGTRDGLFLYSVRDLPVNKKLSDQRCYSDFFVSGNSIIAHTGNGIMQIDIKSGTTEKLIDESSAFHLQFSQGGIFYVKGWTLFRYDPEDKSTKTLFKADNTIKDYWLTSNGRVILRVGSLNNIQETNQFICYNLETDQSTKIDESESELLDYYISDDSSYLVIHKKTVRLKTYELLLVYDLIGQQKFEFDYDSL